MDAIICGRSTSCPGANSAIQAYLAAESLNRRLRARACRRRLGLNLGGSHLVRLARMLLGTRP